MKKNGQTFPCLTGRDCDFTDMGFSATSIVRNLTRRWLTEVDKPDGKYEGVIRANLII